MKKRDRNVWGERTKELDARYDSHECQLTWLMKRINSADSFRFACVILGEKETEEPSKKLAKARGKERVKVTSK